MDWINVNDRLPELDCEQFLIVTYGAVEYAEFHATPFTCEVGDSTNGGEFMVKNCDSDYGGLFLAGDVTYWMPLPKPPAEEVDD